MINIEVIGNELRAAITRFLVPLQTERKLDDEAFEDLHRAANSLAGELKGADTLPRKLMNELYVTIQVIRREGEYFHEAGETLQGMAGRLEMTFSLILKGECHDDRAPGVPRVI